jgi:hypothetical protein
MFEIHSNDIREARREFQQHVNWLVAYAKERRKQGKPLSLLRRKRLIYLLTERWVRHAISTWGPSVVDGEHRFFIYSPPPHLLTKLADVLLQTQRERT